MNRIFIIVWMATIALIMVSACKKESLTFPPTVEDGEQNGVIELIAKPSDVQVIGDYDYKFKVIWPEFSDNVEKVTVAYTDDGEDNSVEVTDFSQNMILTMSARDEYELTFLAYSTGGMVSKPFTIVAENKGLYIEDVVQSMQVATGSPFAPVRLYWANSLREDLEVTCIYPTDSGAETMTITSNADEGEIFFPGLLGGEHSVNIVIKDSRLNSVSSEIKYEFIPVEFATAVQKSGWTPWARHGYDAGFSAERAIDGAIGDGFEFVSGSNGNPTPFKISFTKSRITSDPNYRATAAEFPVGDHNLIVVKSVTIYSGTVDWGVNPSKARVYGILDNDTEKFLGEFEHPTAVTADNPFLIDLSDNFDLLKAIRFDIVNSFSNPTATGMNINEIHLTGFLYE